MLFAASVATAHCAACDEEFTDGMLPTGQDILIFGGFVLVVFLFRSWS